jgi:hypothetical protein
MARPDASNETPKLRGKTVAIFTRYRPGQPQIVLSDCMLETRGDRLFIVGTGLAAQASAPEWTDGVRRSIAWDAVEEYLLFDTPDDYYARAKLAPAMQAAAAAGTMTPMFEMPSGSEGYPVEPSGIPMQPETPLEVGAIVLANSHGQWWRAEVVGLEDGDTVRIHYPGWESHWDTSVPKTDLQVYLGDSMESED